jgi:predicted ATP-grasp superfamily ATP-dependent carboligase
MSSLNSSPVVAPRRILIAGVSTRAAAASAVRAGFDVTSIDGFADLDQHPAVRCLSIPRDFGTPMSAAAAARAARGIECDAVAYLSNFDNHPRALASLAAGRALWGNPPSVLKRVRDPRAIAQALGRRGLPSPDVLAASGVLRAARPSVARVHGASGAARTEHPRTPGAVGGSAGRRWLVKPLASGGGHGVRPWRRGTPVPRRSYLHEFVDGTPGSVVFVAAAGHAVPLGVSRQLVGDPAFGGAGYRYCGNILEAAGDPSLTGDDALFEAAGALAGAMAEDFELVGVNGIDFIAHDRVPWAIEVNPRWSASMELVERAYGLSMFGVHADACWSGTLPDFNLAAARRRARTHGKAVIFARHDVVLGDTREWLSDTTVRDVPHPGDRIRASRPVCTVFAEGADAAECYAGLVGRAGRAYEQLARWEREIA